MAEIVYWGLSLCCRVECLARVSPDLEAGVGAWLRLPVQLDLGVTLAGSLLVMTDESLGAIRCKH